MTFEVQTPDPARAAPRLARLLTPFKLVTRTLNHAQPVAALMARAYVAEAFFLSGLTKVRDWSVTLALFHDEYKVPWLPPEAAAVMGTVGELALPMLLLLGLGGRIPALGLSLVNVVAVLSLTDIAPAALQQHITWGVLLAGLALHGSGPWALDSWLVLRWPVLST